MQEIPILFELIHGPIHTIGIKPDFGGTFWFANNIQLERCSREASVAS